MHYANWKFLIDAKITWMFLFLIKLINYRMKLRLLNLIVQHEEELSEDKNAENKKCISIYNADGQNSNRDEQQ